MSDVRRVVARARRRAVGVAVPCVVARAMPLCVGLARECRCGLCMCPAEMKTKLRSGVQDRRLEKTRDRRRNTRTRRPVRLTAARVPAWAHTAQHETQGCPCERPAHTLARTLAAKLCPPGQPAPYISLNHITGSHPSSSRPSRSKPFHLSASTRCCLPMRKG